MGINKIISTVAVRMDKNEVALLDEVKKEIGVSTASKAFLTLLHYPERYNQLQKDLQKAREDVGELERLIEEKDLKHKDELYTLKGKIQSMQTGIQNFICSFEELRKIEI